MVRAWKRRDQAKLARKVSKSITLDDRQEVFDTLVDEFTARAEYSRTAVHCYLDDKGDVRIVAA